MIVLTHAYSDRIGVRYMRNGLKVFHIRFLNCLYQLVILHFLYRHVHWYVVCTYFLTNVLVYISQVYYLPFRGYYNQSKFPGFFCTLPYIYDILVREEIIILHTHSAFSPLTLESIARSRTMLGVYKLFYGDPITGFGPDSYADSEHSIDECSASDSCVKTSHSRFQFGTSTTGEFSPSDEHVRPLRDMFTVFTDHSLIGFVDLSNVLINSLLEVASLHLDRAICVSRISKQNTLLRSRLPPERIHVIPNAVDTQLFRPHPSQRPSDKSLFSSFRALFSCLNAYFSLIS